MNQATRGRSCTAARGKKEEEEVVSESFRGECPMVGLS